MSLADTVAAGLGKSTGDAYSFAVAGIGIVVRSRKGSYRRESRRAVFETHIKRHDVDLKVSHRELKAESPGRLIFDSEMVWRLYDEQEERVFRFWLPDGDDVPYKELRVGRDYRKGEIVLNEPWQGDDLPDPLEYPLDELLVVHRLGQGLGCELHSCGIVDESGRGWLFVGHSGAGKSTLARLWSDRKVTVLSDDRIILRIADGGVRMYGTPWHGEAGFATAASAPLAGILVIEHGSENAIKTMSSAAAVSELMARAFVPFHEAEALETAVNVLSLAAESLPCCRFGFRPDGSAVVFISDWMRAASDE